MAHPSIFQGGLSAVAKEGLAFGPYRLVDNEEVELIMLLRISQPFQYAPKRTYMWYDD